MKGGDPAAGLVRGLSAIMSAWIPCSSQSVPVLGLTHVAARVMHSSRAARVISGAVDGANPATPGENAPIRPGDDALSALVNGALPAPVEDVPATSEEENVPDIPDGR